MKILFIIRKFLEFIILGLLSAMLLAVPYKLKLTTEAISIIIAASILAFAFFSLARSQERKNKKKHYSHFLAYLSSRLDLDSSLERALYESVEPLTKELGEKNQLIESLKKLRHNLDAQMSLDNVLYLFAQDMDLKICKEDMQLIVRLHKSGGQIDEFVRERQRAVLTEISIEEDVRAEYHGKITEAFMLAAMPFFMAFLILYKDIQNSSTVTSQTWRSLLYLFSVVSVFLVMRSVIWSEAKLRSSLEETKSKNKSKLNNKENKWTLNLQIFYKDFLPKSFSLRFHEAIKTLSYDRDDYYRKYFNKKKLDIPLGIILFYLAVLSGKLPLVVSIILIFIPWILRDIALLAKAKDIQFNYRYYAPHTISSLIILLNSNLTLERSLFVLANKDNFADRIRQPLQQDIDKSVQLIERGYSGTDAINFIADRCPLNELQAIFQLMARYSQEGGNELLELLHLQSQQVWQIYRNSQRNAIERNMAKLLLPMAMDLFLVIATVILPFASEYLSYI